MGLAGIADASDRMDDMVEILCQVIKLVPKEQQSEIIDQVYDCPEIAEKLIRSVMESGDQES